MVDRRPVFLAPGGTLAEIPAGDLISPSVLPDFARTQTPTAIKTGAYTAALSELVMVDATSGPITITLPAIGGQARVSVKKLDASANVVTVTAGTASGGGAQTIGSMAAASVPIRMQDQVTTFQGSGANWVLPYNHLSPSALDNRYRRPTCFDDFTTKANGTLNATASDSGHTWSTVTSGTGASDMVRLGGAIGAASGHTPGGTNGTAAGYAFLQPGGTIGWVGAELRFDTSDSVSSSLCIGAFTNTSIPSTNTGGANMHCSITPWGLQFGVFATGGATELVASGYLVPDGGDASSVRFPNGLICDGATTYRVDIIIDQPRGRAYVTVGDFPTLTYTDPRIRSVAATFAFWEYYSVTGGSNLARFTRVWADPVTAATTTPQATQLTAAAAAAAMSGHGGAGPLATRPSARMRNGSTWYEPGFATTLSAATAANATTFSSPVPIPVGTTVFIDSGLVREVRTTTALSGTGPYTSTVPALTRAHASGAYLGGLARPSFSDGSYWRDQVGNILGNRLSQTVATGSEDTTLSGDFAAGAGSSVSRVRAPSSLWRTGRAYRITSTATGTITAYWANGAVEPSTPAWGGLGQALSATTARNFTVTLRFYDASGAQTGSDVTTSATSAPTVASGSNPGAALTAAAIAPAAATSAVIIISIAGVAATGEVFYVGDPTIGVGPVPAHLRT